MIPNQEKERIIGFKTGELEHCLMQGIIGMIINRRYVIMEKVTSGQTGILYRILDMESSSYFGAKIFPLQKHKFLIIRHTNMEP